MKNFSLSLLALAAVSSTNVFADTIAHSQKLQLGDSTRLYKAIRVLGHSAQPDAYDPALMIHKASFSSSDGALIIQCEKKIKGFDLGSECEVTIDSSLAQSEISSVSVGLVGGVVIVNLSSEQDVDALKRSAASPLGYFQSSEVVEAKLPNGNIGKFPRLKLDCKTSATSCQIALFP